MEKGVGAPVANIMHKRNGNSLYTAGLPCQSLNEVLFLAYLSLYLNPVEKITIMKKITRRRFIRTGLIAGGATMLSLPHFSCVIRAAQSPGTNLIVSFPGDDPMQAVAGLFDRLGGVATFVPKGSSVGILVNSPWKNPGTATHPDVALAVARRCLDAGAEKIVCFKPVPDGYWERSRYFDAMKEQVEMFSYGEERIEVEIPRGVFLKKAEIFKAFLEVDVFISIPVAKHHAGTNFSGNLKGLMGVSSWQTNRFMHSPDGEYTYDKQEYLSQCIADLNLVRKPDLCVVDAMECCLENGPRGPGATVRPNRILAGTDPVALDAYAAQLIGFDLPTIPGIEMAHRLGLGELEPERLMIED
jgi:uncharacterized protein (DUF362 family)